MMREHPKRRVTLSGSLERPPEGSRFTPPRGVRTACRCAGIAGAAPPAEKAGNTITMGQYQCRLVLSQSRRVHGRVGRALGRPGTVMMSEEPASVLTASGGDGRRLLLLRLFSRVGVAPPAFVITRSAATR